MKIIIEGNAEEISLLIHHYLINAFREMGRGAMFHEEEISSFPIMTLTGSNPIHIVERSR